MSNYSSTEDYRIDSLLSGSKWGITDITFSFYSGGSYYGSETGLGVVSDGIKTNVRNILNNVIAPLINVNFVEVSDSASSYGQLRYLLSTSASYAAATYPSVTGDNQAGDVFFNPSYDNSTDTNGFQGGPGTLGYMVIIHETLHALGLKHPGNYNGSDSGDPPFLPYGEDNYDNTVMTYNGSGATPSTPMAYDVLALQYLYGARSFNASNTTYTFTNTGFYSDGLRTVGSSTLSNKLTIWDSDGIDTLNFSSLGSSASGYRFDLNPGGWLSTQTAFNGTGYNVNVGPPVGFTSGTSYYVTTSGTRLAYGVTIENLINSSSNDYIIANSEANIFGGYSLSNITGIDIIEGANNFDILDLSAFTVAQVSQTQSGNNLLLGIGSGRSITIKDYYAVSAASRIQMGFSNLPIVAITQTGGNTQVTEGGATDSYAVVLIGQPSANVVITFNGGTQFSTNVTSLTFTTANWNIAQTVTVTATNDTVGEGTHFGVITSTVTSTDTRFNGLSIAPLQVTITDNDLPTTPRIYAAQTGTANPFNGIDIGYSSTPTFADIDGDGDLDAIVGEYYGTLKYYKNTGSSTTPVYTAQTGAANPFNGINIGISSAPTFADIDGDGDLDAIVGADDGTLKYYKNTGSRTAPVYTAQTGTANPFNGIDIGNYSKPTFADLDADGDLDAIVGAQDGTLYYFQNTGSSTAPVYTEQTGTANPFNGIDIGSFSHPTFADINADGDLDAIVGAQDGTLKYYQNTGSSTAPVYTAQTGAANPFNGIDIGSHSKPTFADINADGDLDAIVGARDGTLRYFQSVVPITLTQTGGNTQVTEGGATDSYTVVLGGQPSADVVITFNGGKQLSTNVITFTAANWNVAQTVTVTATNDTVGEGTHFGVITSTVTSTDTRFNGLSIAPIQVTITDNDLPTTPRIYAAQTGTANPFNGIYIRGYSTPTLADIDGDGDLDGIVGAYDGTLYYYQNTGSSTAPVYTAQTGAANPFNGISVGSLSTPTFADIDGDGDLDALVGAQDGTLKYYQNTGTRTTPVYTAQTGAANPFNGIDIGYLSTPTFVDIDADGDLDAIVGAFDGTLYYFQSVVPNLAPTAISLTNQVTAIAENTSTASRIKVADITVIDDALGTNSLSVTGTDAAFFEIIGTGLFIKAGTNLNFEAKSSYNVTVSVDDTTVGSTPDATANFTLNITDFNEAPTAVTLTNQVTAIAENTSTTTRIKVADIAITDDALGTNNLSVSGTDASFFEVDATGLYIKANTVLNYEAKTNYSVTVNVDDTTVGSTPDATTNFTLTVTDVNEAPTAVSLTNQQTAIAENTSTATRIKVTDIGITDDGLGTNNLSLSGADASFFEVDATGLYIKANTVLNYEAKTNYSVTVNVDDTTVGSTPDATTNFTLTVTDVNEAPTALSLSANSINENVAINSTVGTFSSTDPDSSDAFTYSLVTGTGSTNNSSFTIVNNELRLKISPNFETKASYLVRVRSTDAGGLFTESPFTITINNLTTNTITGTTANETFAATNELDSIDGDGGNDNITATVVNLQSGESFNGNTGVDTFTLSQGNLTDVVNFDLSLTNQLISLTGVSGVTLSNFENINIAGFKGSGTLSGSNVANILTGGVSGDTINGGDGNDNINGGAGNDILNGDVGNDVLNGSVGTDTMTGGTGNDAYYIDNVGDTITELSGEGTDIVYSTLDYSLVGTNLENLGLQGTAINGTGNEFNNSIAGNASNNILSGGIGNDVLNGGVGADSLTGGTGNDAYYIDNVGDTITELSGEGTDTVYSTLDYSLVGTNLENLGLQGTAINGTGNEFNNSITGNASNNVLSGGAGNDVLNGSTGADSLIGGTGNDVYYIENAGDTITELSGEGTETVYSTLDYTFVGTYLENLVLQGTAINGTGNELNNSITGNSSNNILSGGAGNDTLNGSTGADILTGEGGNDLLYLGSDTVTDTVNYASGDGVDTVYNFVRGVGGDVLNFVSILTIDVQVSGSNTLFKVGDGITGNSGFGSGALLLTTIGTTTATSVFVAADVNVHLFGATFAFS